jgi:cytochrome P450
MRPQRPLVGDPVRSAAITEMSPDFPEGAGVLTGLDPPDHTRLRRLLARRFTVSCAAGQRARIERIVADRLDVVERATPPVDLMETFAEPVSSLVMCDLLGVPSADRHGFERPVAVERDPRSSADEIVAAKTAFAGYARALIRRKRVEPGEDVLSELACGVELNDDELTGLAMQLLAAGQDTTASMLGLSAFALLADRTRWETLRSDLSQLDTAVDELLRYLTIVQAGAFTRTAMEDLELGDTRIEAGEAVTVSLSAANWDPQAFSAPDELDLARDARGHMAFGYGRHMCVGQHVARLALRVAFGGLIRRFPTLRLAVEEAEVPMNGEDEFVYGVRALPVVW